jgi:hypothetical protein
MPGPSIATQLRTHDVLRMKQTVQILATLSQTTPSLQVYATRAKGVYYLLQGRYREAPFSLTRRRRSVR